MVGIYISSALLVIFIAMAGFIQVPRKNKAMSHLQEDEHNKKMRIAKVICIILAIAELCILLIGIANIKE